MEFNIYGIFCRTTWKVYYGKTNLTVEKRLEIHKNDYKGYLNGNHHFVSSFEILKNNNYEIKLLEVCDDNLHMKIREGYYIRTFPCVNKNIPGRTQKEYREDNKETLLEKQKEYREKNKEIIEEKNKKWREANKEVIAEYNKEYYEKNKEEINEKKKEKYTCACGSILSKDGKSQHERTKKHQEFINKKK